MGSYQTVKTTVEEVTFDDDEGAFVVVKRREYVFETFEDKYKFWREYAAATATEEPGLYELPNHYLGSVGLTITLYPKSSYEEGDFSL